MVEPFSKLYECQREDEMTVYLEYQRLDRLARHHDAERRRSRERLVQNIKMTAMIVVGSAIVCGLVFAFFTGCEAVFVDVSRQILR